MFKPTVHTDLFLNVIFKRKIIKICLPETYFALMMISQHQLCLHMQIIARFIDNTHLSNAPQAVGKNKEPNK